MNHYWSIAIYLFFQKAVVFLFTYCSSFVFSRFFSIISCSVTFPFWMGLWVVPCKVRDPVDRRFALALTNGCCVNERCWGVVIHRRSWLMYTDLVNCSWVSFMIANYCMLKYVEELNIELQLQVQQKHLPHNSMNFRLQLSLEMTQLTVSTIQLTPLAGSQYCFTCLQ